jgi:hypothetical protein
MRFTLIALFIGFFLSKPGAVAQNFPFVDGLEVRTFRNHSMTGSHDHSITYQLIGDTLIQAQLYHKIYKTVECYWAGSVATYYSDDPTYFSAVRADSGGNIYHFPVNLSAELLTANFSLQVGDSAEFWAFDPSNGYAYTWGWNTVIATDSLYSYGGRRRIQIDGDVFPIQYIEGYGDSRGFVPTGDSELATYGEACFFVNGGTDLRHDNG